MHSHCLLYLRDQWLTGATDIIQCHVCGTVSPAKKAACQTHHTLYFLFNLYNHSIVLHAFVYKHNYEYNIIIYQIIQWTCIATELAHPIALWTQQQITYNDGLGVKPLWFLLGVKPLWFSLIPLSMLSRSSILLDVPGVHKPWEAGCFVELMNSCAYLYIIHVHLLFQHAWPHARCTWWVQVHQSLKGQCWSSIHCEGWVLSAVCGMMKHAHMAYAHTHTHTTIYNPNLYYYCIYNQRQKSMWYTCSYINNIMASSRYNLYVGISYNTGKSFTLTK